jgi:hypothetical protein
MRVVLAWLLVVGCGASPRPRSDVSAGFIATPFPVKPWPAEGLCVSPGSACRKLTPAEVDAVQAAIRSELSPELVAKRPELARARELASWPISTPMIGGYSVREPNPPSSTFALVLEGVDFVRDRLVHGFRITVTETAAGTWTVVRIDPYIEAQPQPT